MSWNTITPENVLEEFTEAERAALTAAQDAVDNLPTILTRTVNMARGMISAGGNSIGAAGTCPDQVIPDVIAVARWRLLVAVPKLRSLCTEERKRAHDDGMRRLESIASGDVKTEVPEEAAATTSPGSGVTLVREPGSNPFSGMGTT
jgi:hypothetical protein